MQQIFAPVEAAILARNSAMVDVFEIIGLFATGDTPFVGGAMALHAKDLLEEGVQDPSQIMVGLYRRTFFDVEAAEKYGTQQFAMLGEDHMRNFAHFLLANMSLDQIQVSAAACDAHPTPPDHQ